MTVGDLGEFGLIAAITAELPRGGRTVVGVGDDAAVLAAPDRRVVATMDLLVEGRHFRRDWSAPADVGGKAAARSLADVAAMGATPVALLVGLAAPGDLPVAWAQDFVSGMAAECARTGATVVGGDVSSADAIMLAVTALGDLAGREPLTRAGARPGDLLAVAGVLGHAAAGLALLGAGLAEPAALVAAYRSPRPPYQAGPEAAVLGAASRAASAAVRTPSPSSPAPRRSAGSSTSRLRPRRPGCASSTAPAARWRAADRGPNLGRNAVPGRAV